MLADLPPPPPPPPRCSQPAAAGLWAACVVCRVVACRVVVWCVRLETLLMPGHRWTPPRPQRGAAGRREAAGCMRPESVVTLSGGFDVVRPPLDASASAALAGAKLRGLRRPATVVLGILYRTPLCRGRHRVPLAGVTGPVAAASPPTACPFIARPPGSTGGLAGESGGGGHPRLPCHDAAPGADVCPAK